jgi:branched-chain amino acid transport system ATP-binding protein
MVDSLSTRVGIDVIQKSSRDPLVVDSVSIAFGGLQVLEGVTLRLRHVERRALIGANGAGKTTLFHLISGILAPSSGKIWLFGKDITGLPVHKRATMGVARTFQITNLLSTLSVLENIVLSLEAQASCRFILHRPISHFNDLFLKAREILETWGLWERRDIEVHSLSYGEQRELEILMALAQQPKLLLLDEPSSGLSSAETINVIRMLHNLPQNVTVLLIEHDMDVAFDVADRISVLHLGRLIAEGSPEDIRQDETVKQIYLGSQRHELFGS